MTDLELYSTLLGLPETNYARRRNGEPIIGALDGCRGIAPLGTFD